MLRLNVTAQGIDVGDLGDLLGIVAAKVGRGGGARSESGHAWSYKLEEAPPARLRLTIETGSLGEGDDRDRDLARILRKVAASVARHGAEAIDGERLRDEVGNTVGRVTYRGARPTKKKAEKAR